MESFTAPVYPAAEAAPAAPVDLSRVFEQYVLQGLEETNFSTRYKRSICCEKCGKPTSKYLLLPQCVENDPSIGPPFSYYEKTDGFGKSGGAVSHLLFYPGKDPRIRVIQYLEWFWCLCDAKADKRSCEVLAGNDKNLPFLVWAIDHGWALDETAYKTAAFCKQFEILKFLLKKAISFEALECLKFLTEENCKQLFLEPLQNGECTLIQWLGENSKDWKLLACSYAAQYGNLYLLQLAHAHGCTWYVTTPGYAAQIGHLAMLEYLVESGCPWDENVAIRAAQNGHLEVLQYLYRIGCPISDALQSSISGNISLQWILHCESVKFCTNGDNH